MKYIVLPEKNKVYGYCVCNNCGNKCGNKCGGQCGNQCGNNGGCSRNFTPIYAFTGCRGLTSV